MPVKTGFRMYTTLVSRSGRYVYAFQPVVVVYNQAINSRFTLQYMPIAQQTRIAETTTRVTNLTRATTITTFELQYTYSTVRPPLPAALAPFKHFNPVESVSQESCIVTLGRE